jgi:hypothetical protein
VTIEQTDKIDFLSVENETGIVKLTISDHLDWSQESDHLLLLQEKINTYLRFIESGELVEVYPDAKGKNVLINIAAKYKPTEKCLEFLGKARSVIEEADLRLNFEHIK